MFCTRCGAKNNDDSQFCSKCGSRLSNGMEKNEQNNIEFSKNISMCKLIFKFKKSTLQFLITNDLEVVIDNMQKINVSQYKPLEYLITPGHHRIVMSFPYMGTNAGVATREFDIYGTETIEITYKPPMIVMMAGTISMKRL